ncbi:MAG: hypothetical protein M0O96_01100 [Desulforhopalus sp.]|nr:hypothetical protein [Desulforhopalus sp.]
MPEISPSGAASSLRGCLAALAAETWQTSRELIRIIIPVVIVTKILEELGLIYTLASLFAPLMELIGLPGELGLVWGTAMMTSLYGGIAVFMSLAPDLHLTSAQITVLASVLLYCHSLPVELMVAKRAGSSALVVGLMRFFAALAYGAFFSFFCLRFNFLQNRPQLLFKAPLADSGLLSWTADQVQNILFIIVIIFCILVVMKMLRRFGVLDLLERLLAPVLPNFGMTSSAAPLTVVGMLMGIGYGGALIIREAQSGRLSREEVFNSMLLLGLCHSLIEDTLLMAAIGGKFIGILWVRMVFSLIFLYLWVYFRRRVSVK